MKVKNIFRIIYGSTIIIVVSILIIALMILQDQALLNQNATIRYKSYQAAMELKQSSEDLTSYCRTYVSTGDSIWEEKYFEVLDIRNGIKQRPDGRKIALKQIMKELDFTDEEFAKIAESEANSNALVWTETVAFNAVKGVFADSNKQFTIKGTPNLELARDLVFNQDYHKEVAKIMKPISEFFNMLDSRTDATVAKYVNQTNTLIVVLSILIAVLLIISILAFMIINKKILTLIGGEPREMLELVEKISQGNFNLKFDDTKMTGLYGAMATMTDILNSTLGGEPKEMLTLANKISNGNFDFNFSNTKHVGMYGAMATMANTIHSMIEEINKLTENSTNGILTYRANADNYKGEYKILIEGINSTLDALIIPMKNAMSQIEQFSQGIIPEIITAERKGELNNLKNNLNKLNHTIRDLQHDGDLLIQGVRAGQIRDIRADATKHQGVYKEIIQGFNDTLDIIAAPILEMFFVLEKLANGDLSQRMQGDYTGTLEIVKQNLNKTIDSFPLEETIKVMTAMSHGDLTVKISKDYKGDFNLLKNSINNLGDSLIELISKLQEAIHVTASASAEISATTDTLALASQSQRLQTEEVAAAMEEMSRTVADNANSAVKTAEVARKSGDVANNGGSVVQQTVEKMREIATVVKTSAENIAKLGENSKKIGEIVSVIDDIADQTNLLSLNAAIEAARAGEQGRGFAVVADSVGKLSVSTAGATKEIAEMIKGIQIDTESAVKAMEKGTTEVQSGIDLADNAGQSLQNILVGINELLGMVNQIAAASEQQSTTSEQIAKNISSISRVTTESVRNIEDVAITANELARMTETLTSLVSQFKVDTY